MICRGARGGAWHPRKSSHTPPQEVNGCVSYFLHEAVAKLKNGFGDGDTKPSRLLQQWHELTRCINISAVIHYQHLMDVREWFFRLGLQYLVAGRFSACAGVSPVGANLLHHALEMLLNGYLSSSMTLGQLKKIGHRLIKLWDLYKANVGDASLNQYDGVVTELDKFEEIRYPDKIVSSGMFVGYSFVRGELVTAGPGRREPVYKLLVAEIDELARTIFESASINVSAIDYLSEDSKTYLTKWNESGLLKN